MIATLLSTVFGVGYARIAPGTIASAVALPLAWLILWKLGPLALAGASVVAFVVGVWSTGAHAARLGREDPSECVIDEVAGQWLACALAPLSLVGFALAFALFRFFDISKLWPVSLGEKLPGGWGIMTDDMIAGALSASLIAGLHWQGLV
ncbi:MAG TPA: phosphatidylglycerophosphatase A [Rhizomicrobium sp.]|jgi:phosphatidylglycerophosphatase A|nr:phosphatidylglycerophosphatase A [Rhizomicrobium sp.]